MRAHPTRFLVTLALLTTSTSVVSSLGAPMVPTIAEEFEVGLSTAQWTLTAAFLVGTVATPVVGRLGAGSRRRVVVLAGLGLVLAGLLACTLPLSFGWLVAGRALQGVGISLVSLALAAAREYLPGDRVAGAMALLSVTTVAGAGLGYPVTAWVAQAGGLRVAFTVGLVVTALTLVCCWRYFPTSAPADASANASALPVLGVLLFGAGALALLLAVSQGPRWGWTDTRVLGLAALGALAMVGWVRDCLGREHPLVDLRAAVRGTALVANLAALFAGIAVYMLIGLVMVHVQHVPHDGFGLGHPISVAGSLLTPYAVATVVGSRFAGRLLARYPSERVLPIGLTCYLLATVTYVLWHDSLPVVALVMVLGGVGSGFSFAAMPAMVVRDAPMSETSSALSFNMVLRYLGFSLGSALATTGLEGFSGGAPTEYGFVATLLMCTGLWVLALSVVLILVFVLGTRRTSRPVIDTVSGGPHDPL